LFQNIHVPFSPLPLDLSKIPAVPGEIQKAIVPKSKCDGVAFNYKSIAGDGNVPR
jgi:hypothetical protein